MTNIVITKNAEGRLCGAGEKHQKSYRKFAAMIDGMEPGEIATISYWFPRLPELHGWHFIVLTAVFNHQEQFEDQTAFRKWIEAGAGHADFLPGPHGKMVAVPKSIGWDELDDEDFKEHHEKAIDFLRSPHCTRFLWGHLSETEQANMIETILTEAEEERQRIRQQRGKE